MNLLNNHKRTWQTLCQLVFLVSFLTLTGCASTSSNEQAQTVSDPRDPLESINRPLWDFNWEVLDKNVLKPASETYVEYTPTVLRQGLYNFAMNLNEPSTIINDLLQLKFGDAAKATGRFIVNSTLGIAGVFDPATSMGLPRKQESFGEVLGVWGVGNGPFLMLPGMGPTDVRDQVGGFVDRYYWPLAIIDFWPNVARVAVLALEGRASLAKQEKLIEDSFDSYEFIKNAHFQNSEFKVYDGNVPIKETEEDEDFDDFLDELDDETYDEANNQSSP